MSDQPALISIPTLEKIPSTVTLTVGVGIHTAAGSRLKEDSGALSARNNADNAYINLRAALATVPHDLTPYMDLLLDSDPVNPNWTYSNTVSGNQVTNETFVRTADSTKIKTVDYTYSGNFVTQEVRKIFDTDGTTIVAQLTINYSYTSGTLSGATGTRNV